MHATIPRPRSVALRLAARAERTVADPTPARASASSPTATRTWRDRRGTPLKRVCVYASVSVAANSRAGVATARYLAMLVAIDQIRELGLRERIRTRTGCLHRDHR
jgi:hypothetical protein